MTAIIKLPPLEQIADNIHDLTKPTTTTEQVTQPELLPSGKWRQKERRHDVTHASLLDQLRTAVQQSTADGAWGGGDAKSKPSASLDAIDALARIERECSAWQARLKAHRRGALEVRLSELVGAVASDEEAQRVLARDSKSWLLTARIVTGWERRPFEPDVPCPNDQCERWGTLRIRLDQQIATCIECGTVWDPPLIEGLGAYVRWADEHLHKARHWLVDEAGFPTECIECLAARQEMAARSVLRAAAGRHGERISA